MKKNFNKFLSAGTELYYNPVKKIKIKGIAVAIRYSLKNNWIESILFKPDKNHEQPFKRLLKINNKEINYSPFEKDEYGAFAGIDFKNREDILNTVKETEIKSYYDFNEEVYVFYKDISYKGKVKDIIYIESKDNTEEINKICYLISLKRRRYNNTISLLYSKEDIYTKEEILKEVERRL